jgi:hypothetical protein
MAGGLSFPTMKTPLPEGFEADEDGNYKGIEPWAMLLANSLCGAITNRREWDVPMVAAALVSAHEEGQIKGITYED